MPTRKNGVINIKNNDDKCFMWSILAALHPAPYHPERITHYKQYESKLNFKGMDFPIRSDEMTLRKFE